MKPLYPAILNPDEAISLKWTQRSENRSFFNHILRVCHDFPSLLFAYSETDNAKAIAAEISRSLLDLGINVFLPAQAVPLCAFSQSVSARQVPIGLYLTLNPDTGYYNLLAITNHGGPIDENDVNDKKIEKNENQGVMGTTDYNRVYLKNLAGLADPFVDPGVGFSNFDIPFSLIADELKTLPETKNIFGKDPDGPSAILSPDGQGLTVISPEGNKISDQELCETILAYMIKERMASGSIVGPAGKYFRSAESCEYVEIEGGLFDMNYHAGFADLLIGWWPGGIIAHQGSSCFGDGILTAIYYLEGLRSL
jgi:hypothetical protein